MENLKKTASRLFSRIPHIDRGMALSFFVFYFLSANYLVYSFLDLQDMKNGIRIAIIVVLALYCLYLLLAKKTNIRFFIFVGLAVLFLIIGSGIAINLAFLLLLMAVLVDVDVFKAYNAAFKSNMLMLMIILMCLLFGIVENVHYINPDGRSRNTFGFTNVNAASMFVFSLVVSYLLSRNSKRYKYVPLVLILATAVYLLTDSRTAFLCTLFMLVAWFAVYALPRPVSRIFSALFVIMMFLAPVAWSIPQISQGRLNTLLSSRPVLYLQYIQQHDVLALLFGGSRVEEVDNYYLIQLFGCGIFVYIICAASIITAVDVLIKKKRHAEAAFCLSMLLYGQFEGTLIRPEIACVPMFWMLVCQNATPAEALSILLNIRDHLMRAFAFPRNRIRKNSHERIDQ